MKQKKTNNAFMINRIKNLLKRNYKIEPDLIDVEAEVDSTLTFQENWNQIKRKYINPTSKRDKNYLITKFIN